MKSGFKFALKACWAHGQDLTLCFFDMATTAMYAHVLCWHAHTAMHFVLRVKYSEMAMLDAKWRHKFGHVGFTLCRSTDA
jgi:hypothetical protein